MKNELALLGLAIVFLIYVPLEDSYAESQLPKVMILPDHPVWGLKLAIEDFNEFLAAVSDDQVKLSELKAKHASNRQAEIEQCKNCKQEDLVKAEKIRKDKNEQGEQIILNIEQRMPEKAQEQSQIISKLRTVFSLAKNLDEINEVQIAVAEFQELRKTEGIDKAEKAREIDDRVNSLEITKELCNGQRISTIELSEESDPYSALQKKCRGLDSTSARDAYELLYNNDE